MVKPSSPPRYEHHLSARIRKKLGVEQLPEELRAEPTHQGPRRKLLGWQLIAGMVAQSLHACGSLQQIIGRYFAVRISSAALSQRRLKISTQAFDACMRHALVPLACEQRHPACFFAGLRLVGIDGGQWNLLNTVQINAQVPKSRSRRAQAAFAKLSMSTLVELGTHAPLAVSMSLGALNEKSLADPLLAALPARSLLIADRYYGQAPMLKELQKHSQRTQSHFLVRVRQKLSVRVQSVHADGSAEVVVSLRERESPCADSSTTAPSKADEKQTPEANKARGRPRKHPPMRQSELPVREIVGRVRNAAGEWVKVRLWTSLSVQQGSARELLALYAKRWEQEVFYKELKLVLHGGHLLSAQRTETAQQELAALLIASSLVAEERLACAQSSEDEEVRQAGVLRISMSHCLEHTVALLLVLEAAQGLMDEAAQGVLVRRVREQIAQAALPARRRRSCQRKVRQPVSKWPRLLSTSSLQASDDLIIDPFA